MAEEQIGLIGIGLMGTALAERLLAAGFGVLGHDADSERCRALEGLGGVHAASAREVTGSCERIVLSLPTTDIVEQVIEDAGSELSAGTIVIDTTTGDPVRTAALGAQLAQRSVRYLDATISGSSEQTRCGEVTAMVGGEADTFGSCRDLFSCFASQCIHVGPCGSGAKMKLVTNLVLGLNRAALAEGLAFAETIGLSQQTALDVLLATMAYSRIMDTKGQKMVDRDFTAQAKLSQHLKDVRLILTAAEAEGRELPLSVAHRQLLEEAEAAGLSEADNSAIIEAYFSSHIR